MGVPSSGTFEEAYLRILQDLLENGDRIEGVQDPNSVGSNFGQASRPTRELIGYTFKVEKPAAATIVSPERPIRIPFCVGLFLWTISGSDSQDWIRYYNPQSNLFSDDGVHMTAAFGERLFAHEGLDQIEAVIKTIGRDPNTRRGLATISLSGDNVTTTRDYPCAIAVQYLRRGDSLHALTFMRSQSALMVLPYDAFLFMSLQQWLATRMGLQVGSYRHLSGSIHVYEDELETLERVLGAGVESASFGDMHDRGDSTLPELLSLERELRTKVEHDGGASAFVGDAVTKELERVSEAPPSFFDASRRILLVEACSRLQLDEEQQRMTASLPLELQQAIRLRPSAPIRHKAS